MKKDLTLLILAAGMGSRFGGLKQIEPLGPNGEFIIDYSVYDAIEAGFSKIVFLIKEENFDLFKETIGKRVEPYINVEYCFQNNDNVDDKYLDLKSRVKPLGTAHAILCCKDKINGPFMTINADDFYGRDAFFKGADFLRNINNIDTNFALIGYSVINTMTEFGSVKRGVCKIEDNYLTKLIESSIEKISNEIIATPLVSGDKFVVQDDDVVSMNMFLLTPSIFDYLEKNFSIFLREEKNNFEKCEYLIPEVLFKGIKEKYCSIKVIPTTSSWHGVTYKEDTEGVKNSLKKLVDDKVYKKDLWK